MQVWIYGNSQKDYILGFFVVDPDRTKRWAKEKNLEFNQDLMANEELKQIVFDDIIRLANENKFSSLEKPKQMHLILEPWTPEQGILTPT